MKLTNNCIYMTALLLAFEMNNIEIIKLISSHPKVDINLKHVFFNKIILFYSNFLILFDSSFKYFYKILFGLFIEFQTYFLLGFI